MEQTNKKLVMTGLMVGTFLTAIEGTVVSTAMPQIVGDLQGIRIMDWVFSIFLLTSAVTVPIFGRLADLFGRKLIFNCGALFFLIGSVLCGLSQSMTALIIFRGVQGIGAGAVMTLSTTIIGDIYPVESRARMFGMIGMIWGIAGIFGPLAGGFFVDTLSWHWIFFINLPFGMLAILLVSAGLRQEPGRKKEKIDFTGAAAFAISIVALLYGLQKAGEGGSWFEPGMIGFFSVFVIFLGFFFIIERRTNEPMIPLVLFKKPIVVVTNVLAACASAILIGTDIYLPMWLQGLLGFRATAAGLVLAPMSVAWMSGSFLCGRLLTKYGIRVSGLIGSVPIFAGTLWLVVLVRDYGGSPLFVITAIIGVGFGILLTLTTICVQSAVGFHMRGAATASNQFCRSLGQTVGAAAFGTCFNTQAAKQLSRQDPGTSIHALNRLIHPASQIQLPEKTAELLKNGLYTGIHQVFILLMGLALITLLLAWFLPKNRPDSYENK
ncbi:DHA2 family efflux MFS transporter permease subunit [Sporolactobacillus sp. THM7-4]|nr:DHA2 family efflux MFS transporter permease subunit [Sporolactobacillus sp. THM7-4]